MMLLIKLSRQLITKRFMSLRVLLQPLVHQVHFLADKLRLRGHCVTLVRHFVHGGYHFFHLVCHGLSNRISFLLYPLVIISRPVAIFIQFFGVIFKHCKPNLMRFVRADNFLTIV